MIKRGDKYLSRGVVLEIKNARVDDNFIYVTFDKVGFLKLPLKYFFEKYICLSDSCEITIDYYRRIKQRLRDSFKYKLSI